MASTNVKFADKITNKCIAAYAELSRNGKPVENEWTVLSCVVQNDKSKDKLEVVSLGTGSKCIGATKMSHKGDVLNDSHAEVFARRGFLLYLYDSMKSTLKGETTIFCIENDKFYLKDEIEFYFYSSQLPCGDACIMPKSIEEEFAGDVLENNKRPAEECADDLDTKRQKNENGDIHRTGGKCLSHSEQDSRDPGVNYHVVGQVRTKPGRGDRTLSVSCSDKIARWICLGIQGALLEMILKEPIYIKKFVFGAGVPYSEESVQRALLIRNSIKNNFKLDFTPEFCQATVLFPQIKNEQNIRPAPGSIVWVKIQYLCAEVAVQGRKLGVTKKKAASLSSSLCISKYNLYKRFLEVRIMQEESKGNSDFKETILCLPYNEMKQRSVRYNEKWSNVKNQFFGTWTVKPNMWDFCVDKV